MVRTDMSENDMLGKGKGPDPLVREKIRPR